MFVCKYLTEMMIVRLSAKGICQMETIYMYSMYVCVRTYSVCTCILYCVRYCCSIVEQAYCICMHVAVLSSDLYLVLCCCDVMCCCDVLCCDVL